MQRKQWSLLQGTRASYPEVPLGLSLLSGPGHLWNLEALQAQVVPSVLEVLRRELWENTVDSDAIEAPVLVTCVVCLNEW